MYRSSLTRQTLFGDPHPVPGLCRGSRVGWDHQRLAKWRLLTGIQKGTHEIRGSVLEPGHPGRESRDPVAKSLR